MIHLMSKTDEQLNNGFYFDALHKKKKIAKNKVIVTKSNYNSIYHFRAIFSLYQSCFDLSSFRHH